MEAWVRDLLHTHTTSFFKLKNTPRCAIKHSFFSFSLELCILMKIMHKWETVLRELFQLFGLEIPSCYHILACSLTHWMKRLCKRCSKILPSLALAPFSINTIIYVEHSFFSHIQTSLYNEFLIWLSCCELHLSVARSPCKI